MEFIVLLVVIFPLVLTDGSFFTANKKFTPQIYKEVAKTTSDNFLLSPLSAQTILSLTQAGAKGETAEELRQSLQLPNDQAKIETSTKQLLDELNKTSDSYTLYTANKIYVKEDFTIKSNFIDIATNVFGAAPEKINFLKKSEAAKTINDWVEQQTNNKIRI